MEMFFKDKLKIQVFADRDEMGKAAAAEVAAIIKQLLKYKENLSLVFAAAPSQNEFLKALSDDNEIDFTRIIAYHMDEYIGLSADAPQGFGNFLKNRILGYHPFKAVHYINGGNSDPEQECNRYASLLNQTHIDIVLLGIGENGHIAFNDPSVANFHDPKTVKVVTLEETCRHQQVNDGCFENIDQVPRKAITLTIPALISADYHFAIVPSNRKALAIRDTLNGPISETCPASILRTIPNSSLYLDIDSASMI